MKQTENGWMESDREVSMEEVKNALLSQNRIWLADACKASLTDACTGMLVFSRYSLRNNSSASLSVFYEQADGKTRVFLCVAGEGNGLLDLNFGFGAKFLKESAEALRMLGFHPCA